MDIAKDEYKVGDLLLAKIGKSPRWPSIICDDPVTKIHIRNISSEFPIVIF